MCGWRCLAARKVLPHWSIPRTVHRRKTQALLLVIDLECALDKNFVERKGRQTVDCQHCGRPRPPLCTTNVKGTFVPAPRPVISAIPVSVAVSSCTLAPVTLPTTYIAFTVN